MYFVQFYIDWKSFRSKDFQVHEMLPSSFHRIPRLQLPSSTRRCTHTFHITSFPNQYTTEIEDFTTMKKRSLSSHMDRIENTSTHIITRSRHTHTTPQADFDRSYAYFGKFHTHQTPLLTHSQRSEFKDKHKHKKPSYAVLHEYEFYFHRENKRKAHI